MNLLNQPIHVKTPNLRGTPAEKRFYKWLHTYGVCCLTGQPQFEIAHTGGYAEGKGTARKAHVKTCLPLIRSLHIIEERNRAEFWDNVGFPDYLARAERLYDNYEAGYDPRDLLLEMSETCNRAFVIDALST